MFGNGIRNLIAFSCLGVMGCVADSPDQIEEDEIRVYDELQLELNKIDDKWSAKEVKPRLKQLAIGILQIEYRKMDLGYHDVSTRRYYRKTYGEAANARVDTYMLYMRKRRLDGVYKVLGNDFDTIAQVIQVSESMKMRNY